MTTKIEDLEARLRELEKASQPQEPFKPAKPWAPVDHTRNASLDPQSLRDLAAGVERYPGEVAREQSRPVQLPSVGGASSGKPGGNFVEPRPLVSESWLDPNRPPPPKVAE